MSTPPNSIKDRIKQFEKDPSKSAETSEKPREPIKANKSKLKARAPTVNSTTTPTISKERQEVELLKKRKRETITDMHKKFESGEASVVKIKKTEVERYSNVNVSEKSEVINRRVVEFQEKQKSIYKLAKHTVAKEKKKAVYIHPYSEDNKCQVFLKKNSNSKKNFTAFIDTENLAPGEYCCKPYIEVGLSKEKVFLQEFEFKVDSNGIPDPDFHDLQVVDVNFEFRNEDEPIANTEAKFTFQKQNESVKIEFESETNEAGMIRQVLPPGEVKILIETDDIKIENTSQIIEPTQLNNREAALKIEPSRKVTSENTKLAGSSLDSDGSFVILGDASGSMLGEKFEALIRSLNYFVYEALKKGQEISIAVWGEGTNWFNNGNFITASDWPALQEFLEQNSDNGWVTNLEPTFKEVFTKYPDIENVLVFCDGDIDDIDSVYKFAPIRDAHPDTKFHFTGIGTHSPTNLEQMAQYGNGMYEHSFV